MDRRIRGRKTDNPASGYRGERVGGDPEREEDHFMLCPECGQAFDMRNLGEVLHHHEPGHDPLPNDD